MSPEFLDKWEHILGGVEKNGIPIEFVKKKKTFSFTSNFKIKSIFFICMSDLFT